MQMATEERGSTLVPPWKIELENRVQLHNQMIKIRIRREWSSLSFTFT